MASEGREQHRRNEDFVRASERNDLAGIRALLEGSVFHGPVDKDYVSNWDGKSALMAAAFCGHARIVEELIARKVSVDLKCKKDDNWTALFFSAVNGHVECTRLLLEAGADPDARDQDKATPIMMAAASHKSTFEVTELLLMHGADVNASDKDRTTSLMYAAQAGNFEVAQQLLKWGALVNARDKDGSTALMYASAKGSDSVVELLIRSGADLNSQDHDGWTPLIDAARNGQSKVAEILLKYGASLTAATKNGKAVSPLEFASDPATREVIKRASKSGFQTVTPTVVKYPPMDPTLIKRAPPRARNRTLRRQLSNQNNNPPAPSPSSAAANAPPPPTVPSSAVPSGKNSPSKRADHRDGLDLEDIDEFEMSQRPASRTPSLSLQGGRGTSPAGGPSLPGTERKEPSVNRSKTWTGSVPSSANSSTQTASDPQRKPSLSPVPAPSSSSSDKSASNAKKPTTSPPNRAAPPRSSSGDSLPRSNSFSTASTATSSANPNAAPPTERSSVVRRQRLPPIAPSIPELSAVPFIAQAESDALQSQPAQRASNSARSLVGRSNRSPRVGVPPSPASSGMPSSPHTPSTPVSTSSSRTRSANSSPVIEAINAAAPRRASSSSPRALLSEAKPSGPSPAERSLTVTTPSKTITTGPASTSVFSFMKSNNSSSSTDTSQLPATSNLAAFSAAAHAKYAASQSSLATESTTDGGQKVPKSQQPYPSVVASRELWSSSSLATVGKASTVSSPPSATQSVPASTSTNSNAPAASSSSSASRSGSDYVSAKKHRQQCIGFSGGGGGDKKKKKEEENVEMEEKIRLIDETHGAGHDSDDEKREKKPKHSDMTIINVPASAIPGKQADRDRKYMNDDAVAVAVVGGLGAGAVAAGAVGLGVAAKTAIRFAPVFNSIFLIIGSIDRLVTNVIANKDNCRYIALRCMSMKGILVDFQPHFDPTRERVETLALLVEEFEKTLQLVQRYTEASWVRKIVSANTIRSEFVSQDRKLTSLIGDLMMGMHNRSLSELQSHLPYIETQLDTLRSDIVSFRGEMSDELKELKDMMKQALIAAGAPNKQLSGERGVHRSSSARVLQLAQQLVKDELSPDEVNQLFQYCTRANRIGKGSFGTVYRGDFCGVPVAIKELDISDFSCVDKTVDALADMETAQDDDDSKAVVPQRRVPNRRGSNKPSSVQRIVHDFKQEVAVLRLLRSSRLVQFVGACTAPPNLLIVTEYVDGGSLYDYLQSSYARANQANGVAPGGPSDDEPLINYANPSSSSSPPPNGSRPVLTDEFRLRIATQVAQGLAFLHQHKPPIIHRDLKSRNILLDKYLNAKICDFGLSRTMTHSNLSTVHGNVGTPQYMAPEALRAQNIGPKADVYSFGVLLLELWTGQVPWQDLKLVQIVTKVLIDKEKIEIPESIPKEIAYIIRGCLEFDHENRFDIATVLRLLIKINL